MQESGSIQVQCPNCKAVYLIEKAKIPDTGAVSTCRKCQGKIIIRKSDSIVPEATEKVEDEKIQTSSDSQVEGTVVCPKCGFKQVHPFRCYQCGFVFQEQTADQKPLSSSTTQTPTTAQESPPLTPTTQTPKPSPPEQNNVSDSGENIADSGEKAPDQLQAATQTPKPSPSEQNNVADSGENVADSGEKAPDQLQAATDFKRIRAGFRSMGIAVVVLGLISLMFLDGASNDLAAVAAVAIAFCAMAGFWLAIAISTASGVTAALSLVVLGVIDLLLGIQLGSGLFSFLPAFIDFWYAAKVFSNCSSYAEALQRFPGAEMMKTANRLVVDVKKARASSTPNLVEFLEAGSAKWRGLLLDTMAVFVKGNKKEVFFVPKSAVRMSVKDGASCGQKLAAVFQLKHKRFEGKLKPEFYERYKAWVAQI
ncbi:MAG: zinc-ribbon domain-containing protein [bacterium]